MKRSREEHDQDLDAEQYIDQEDDQDDDLDEAQAQKSEAEFKEELLGQFVDLNALLKKLREKAIQREFQKGRPEVFLAVLVKLLSLELDATQEPQREEALNHLSQIEIPRIKKPQANYFLYFIGIKYAHQFSKRRDIQSALFNRMSKITKGGEAILACMQGDLKKLRNLVSLEYAKGQEKNFPSLCLFATANKQSEVVRFLHKHGKVARSEYVVFDPLFHAAAYGLDEMIPVLLECCGQKDRDPTIIYPSTLFPHNSYSLKVIFLHNDRYGSYRSPLLLAVAAAHGQLETVKLLQARGFKDEDMFCCLRAAENGHFQVAEHLLSEFLNEESDLCGIARVPGRMLAIMEKLVLNRQENLLQGIVKLFKKPDGCDIDLRNLLLAAAQEDNLEILIWLQLDLAQLQHANSILRTAILNGSLKILTYLFENISPKGKYVAAIYDELRHLAPTDEQYPNFKKSFHYLAQIGVDFSFQYEADGRNLQGHFVEINHPRVVELLSEHGVDPSVRGHDGKSAYELCQSVDMATALLKFKPTVEVMGVARICPFSAKQIFEFNRVAYVSYNTTQDKQKLASDHDKILRIFLQSIEDQCVLIEKGDPCCLNAALVFTHELSGFLLACKWEAEFEKRIEKIKHAFLLLRLRIRLKGLEAAIAKLRALFEGPESDEEMKTEALNKAKEILVEGTGIDPLLFAEELKKLFRQYLESEDLESYEILLGFILGLEKSLPQFILCRAIGEFLHAFGSFPLKDHHAYLCFNEAVKNNTDEANQDYAAVASLATKILSKLMEEVVDCEITRKELEAKNPKKFAEVMARLDEEFAKFAYLKVAASNDTLLIYAAGQGNLKIVKGLFEEGQFSFEKIGAVLIKAKDAALQRRHYSTVAYLVVNAVRALVNRKLYQEGDCDALQNLFAYLNRQIIPLNYVNDETLAQMRKLAAQKNELNVLLCEIHSEFAPKALRGLSPALDKLLVFLQKTSLLENYILKAYDAPLFQESLSDDFIALLNGVLVMAHHKPADPSLQSIINFLIERLASSRRHIALAIILCEYIQDKTLGATRRIYLFNELSQSTYSSLDEFKQNSTFKLLAFNLYVRAVWCVLLGWEKRNCGEIIVELACDDSAQFWARYEKIKGEMNQFLVSHPRPCHQYELFSSLESECMLAFIKGEQQLSFSERDGSRPSSTPGLFKKRAAETELIQPADQKQAKPEPESVDNSMK